MSLNTKEFEKALKKLTDYFEREQIRFVLCTATTKEEVPTFAYFSNQGVKGTIQLLTASLCKLTENSFCQEDSDVFITSLTKPINKLLSAPTKEQLQQLIKNQLGGEA